MIRDHNLHEHLALRLASQDCLDPFKTCERVLRVPLPNMIFCFHLEEAALTTRKQRLQRAERQIPLFTDNYMMLAELILAGLCPVRQRPRLPLASGQYRSEEHTSELQSHS